MNHPSFAARTAVLSCIALFGTGCYSEPDPPPVRGAAKYHQAFDAALGAAGDVGIEVRSSDREAGRIAGKKGDVDVSIWLQWQPSGQTKIEFDAPGSAATDPKLSERWTAAYNRRMGR